VLAVDVGGECAGAGVLAVGPRVVLFHVLRCRARCSWVPRFVAVDAELDAARLPLSVRRVGAVMVTVPPDPFLPGRRSTETAGAVGCRRRRGGGF